MAGKGGYQQPGGPRPPGGPGKLSQRTDGNVQAVRVPNVGDSPDLQQGDRQRLEQAQHIAKLNAPPSVQPSRLPQGTPLRPGELPPWMFDQGSNRPNEPGTAGMDQGPGPGSDVLTTSQPADDLRITTLRYLSSTFGNTETYSMLHEMLQGAPQAPQMGPPEIPSPVPTGDISLDPGAPAAQSEPAGGPPPGVGAAGASSPEMQAAQGPPPGTPPPAGPPPPPGA